MTFEELFDQLLNEQLAQKLGTDYGKICNNIDSLTKTNNDNYNELKNLESDVKKCFEGCKLLQDAINENIKKNKELEQKIGKIETLEIDINESIKQRNELDQKIIKKELFEAFIKKSNDNQSQFGQQINNKLADLENKNINIMQYCKKLESEKDNTLKRISALEEENRKLSKKIDENEMKDGKFQCTSVTTTRNELFDNSVNNIQKEQTNNIIKYFNSWAANPFSMLPSKFAYLTGDFRIRTNQQELRETQEETKWIINREGGKKYLLPNPIFFDQMTNISDLYKMDLNTLKGKGKNKIKIIIPCEISSSGFIEFPGELIIL